MPPIKARTKPKNSAIHFHHCRSVRQVPGCWTNWFGAGGACCVVSLCRRCNSLISFRFMIVLTQLCRNSKAKNTSSMAPTCQASFGFGASETVYKTARERAPDVILDSSVVAGQNALYGGARISNPLHLPSTTARRLSLGPPTKTGEIPRKCGKLTSFRMVVKITASASRG